MPVATSAAAVTAVALVGTDDVDAAGIVGVASYSEPCH